MIVNEIKIRKAFGLRLRNWRKKKKKLTLNNIADDIQFSQGALSNIENGDSAPSYPTLCSLIKKYPDENWMKIIFDR